MWCCNLSKPSPVQSAGEGRVGAERSEVLSPRDLRGPTSLRSAPTPTLPRLRRGRGHAMILACLLLLTGCGFQPLYGARSGVPNEAVQAMAETRIALIPDRA